MERKKQELPAAALVPAQRSSIPDCLRCGILVCIFFISIAFGQNGSPNPFSNPATNEQDKLARQQAEEVITKFKNGQTNQLWLHLRQSSDPNLRAYLIHSLAPRGINSAVVIKRLKSESEVSVRRALILSLGQFSPAQITPTQKQNLVPLLLRWYQDDPDAGIHSAIDWLLRYGQQGNKERKLDWQQGAVLRKIDEELAGQKSGKRNWYVTQEGVTMTIVRGPITFTMGSPESEAGRTPDELEHRVLIPRSYTIATKETMVSQFQKFMEANPKMERWYPDPTKDPTRSSRIMKQFSPDDECPQIAVTWYEAAQFCNWLSQQEGFPESEWVYPANSADFKDGLKLPDNYLHRTGYRLLTEAEWEYASRAGSMDSHSYGFSEEILSEYAWYSKHPPQKKDDPNDPHDPQRTALVGQFKPNDWGLFDIYGNVWEWIQDRRLDYPSDKNAVRKDEEDLVLIILDTQARVRRGGSYSYPASVMRSAHRGATNYFPMQRRDSVGFRIGRTYR